MNNEQQTTAVQMTAEEAAQFAAFKEAQAKKAAEEKKRKDREAYAMMVDEAIEVSMPSLTNISDVLTHTKQTVINTFKTALEMKGELLGIREDQRSHTFTNSKGTMRITLGVNTLDNYGDMVNEGIAIVKEYLASLAKDAESEALVNAVLRLMSKDQAGNLKASRVLQLRKMAEDSGNERFLEGVKIIEESYQPTMSKQFVRAEIKGDNGEWKAVPLGMTES